MTRVSEADRPPKSEGPIKKQSFYVWFLGAQESRGLKGEHFVQPVLDYLLDREKDVEPTKVTLQISGKGLKIVQNVARPGSRNGKSDQIKHLIPQHAVTYVTQSKGPHDDVVCCILLIYNPVTKCPVHVHGYRCDSVETATSLRQHLEQLVGHPENVPKYVEMENRLKPSLGGPCSLPVGRLNNRLGNSPYRPVGSDGRSTRTDEEDPDLDGLPEDGKLLAEDDLERSIYEEETIAVTRARPRESNEATPPTENSEETLLPQDPNVVRLYGSLAQELKMKLMGTPNGAKSRTVKPQGPLLLPPKDYDTVCRRHGNLSGIDFRRSTNQNIVGAPGSPQSTDEGLEKDPRKALSGTDHSRTTSSHQRISSKAKRLASNSSGHSSGIGSDELIVDSNGQSPLLGVDGHTEEMTSSEDEWNYRPANRLEDRKQLQHRSMDFLQQRLNHFHMGEVPTGVSSPVEKRRPQHHKSSSDLHTPKPLTFFGQEAQPAIQAPMRSMSNHNLLRPPSRPSSQKPTQRQPSPMKQSTKVVNQKRAGDRPISFPIGVQPIRKDIPLLQPPPRYGYHQHPLKETMIEPAPNARRAQSPNEFRQRSDVPGRKGVQKQPMEKASKSAYFSHRPPLSGVEAFEKQPEGKPDLRRQSLAESGFYRDGTAPPMVHDRNPLAKYFVDPLERRAFANRYSVAEPQGHRIY